MPSVDSAAAAQAGQNTFVGMAIRMTTRVTHTEQEGVKLDRYLARRLKPLAVGIALLIAFLFPITYYIHEYRNLRHTASVYAESFAAKLKGTILSDQALWKDQTDRYLQLLHDFPGEGEIVRIRVLDETGRFLKGYEYLREKSWPFHDFDAPPGSAPLSINDRIVGRVEISLSLGPLLYITAVLFLISSFAGTGLGALVYFFPLRVVRRMEGEIQGLIATVHDAMNESDRLRTAAQASELRFREFVQGLDAIVWEADAATWCFSFVSQQAVKILGYPVEQWLAAPRFPVRHIHPDDRERVLACYLLAIQEESGFQLEYRLYAADRRVVWIQDFVRLSRGDGPGSRQMSGIMVDITERKRAEEVLAEQTRELARSNVELEQFAYVASHDLQEPLRMVSSYMQLIERRYQDKLDQDATEFIAFAVEGATRMQRLIHDLLTYSRVGTRGKELQPTDATVALKHALANLQLAIEESGAVIDFEPLPTVMGDPTQLIQLFQNLVGNAIKFRGARPLQVQVRAYLEEEEWQFQVRDNGIGIAPEYFERIFLIFQRLHDRTRYSGTGIGLAVCKKIVERHGGYIWIESVQDQGATFCFKIPVMRRERA
jgi:PAS domain S-box-containing protein